MGNFKKDDLTLDFHGVKTENMSSTIPYLNKLNADANLLTSHLYQPTVNRKTIRMFNDTENYDMYKLFEKTPHLNNNDNNFSETSAFISSDDYKNLLNKQRGGGDDDDSSTSSSSSSSSSSNKKSSKKE